MATPIVMPRLGDFMTEGTVVSLSKSQGDEVNQGEVIAEIETEKLNYDLESVAGGIFHPIVDAGATVAVDGLIGYVLEAGEDVPSPETPAASARAARRTTPRRGPSRGRGGRGDTVRSTPGARRLAANLNVELSKVTPTGPRGRIVEADVRAFADSQAAEQAPAMPPGLPELSRSEPLSGMRRGIAQHMSESLRSTAQLSYFLEVDVTEAQRLRREASAEHDTTLTIAHVLIKACAETLKRIPVMNTVLANDEVHYFDQVNIGVAVALDDGLIVPVLRNVGNMDIYQISTATHEMAIKAREGTLSPDDVLGGTFTISVLGVVDGFTPILNRPQSGILGVGRSAQKPVVARGEVVVREMMTLSLTADHQVIDGAVAAAFMRRLQATVERPAALFR